MAATTNAVLNNIFLALAIMLLFLPLDLFLPMSIASLVAFLATNEISFPRNLITKKDPFAKL